MALMQHKQLLLQAINMPSQKWTVLVEKDMCCIIATTEGMMNDDMEKQDWLHDDHHMFAWIDALVFCTYID